jgi:hypothetical protein
MVDYRKGIRGSAIGRTHDEDMGLLHCHNPKTNCATPAVTLWFSKSDGDAGVRQASTAALPLAAFPIAVRWSHSARKIQLDRRSSVPIFRSFPIRRADRVALGLSGGDSTTRRPTSMDSSSLLEKAVFGARSHLDCNPQISFEREFEVLCGSLKMQ